MMSGINMSKVTLNTRQDDKTNEEGKIKHTNRAFKSWGLSVGQFGLIGCFCMCLSFFEESTHFWKKKTPLQTRKQPQMLSKKVHQSWVNHQVSQGEPHPTGLVCWFPMYHIYIGLCVSLSMPMQRKGRQQEPSNLFLMQFQLRWHCSHSQTIKVSLWVFDMISFITPVWSLGGCPDKIQCPSWKRSTAACCWTPKIYSLYESHHVNVTWAKYSL